MWNELENAVHSSRKEKIQRKKGEEKEMWNMKKKDFMCWYKFKWNLISTEVQGKNSYNFLLSLLQHLRGVSIQWKDRVFKSSAQQQVYFHLYFWWRRLEILNRNGYILTSTLHNVHCSMLTVFTLTKNKYLHHFSNIFCTWIVSELLFYQS